MVFLVEEFFAEELFAELCRASGWPTELFDDRLAGLPADVLDDAWVAPEDFRAELVEGLEGDAPAVE